MSRAGLGACTVPLCAWRLPLGFGRPWWRVVAVQERGLIFEASERKSLFRVPAADKIKIDRVLVERSVQKRWVDRQSASANLGHKSGAETLSSRALRLS
jgi:hypothetical protein